MKNRIIWKFFSNYAALIFLTVFIILFFVGFKLKNYYESEITRRLETNALLIAENIRDDLTNEPAKILQEKVKEISKKISTRTTLISNHGRVIADSLNDYQLMDNHNDRLEIIRARSNDFGESIRYSDTLSENMKYLATAVKKNDQIIAFVRLSLPLSEIQYQVQVIYQIIITGAIFSLLLVIGLSYFISKRNFEPIEKMKNIAQNIAKGDFSKRIAIKTNDELGELAESLNQMADELEHKIESLKKTDAIKTNLVANVSHELKTPLTSIKGFIETLEDGALDDKENAKRFLSIIKKRTEGLNNIINDLLIFSELESSRLKLNKEKFLFKDLLNEIVLSFGFYLKKTGQDLKITFSDEELFIYADRIRIEQVFVNIIDNAIKYNKPQGKIIINSYRQNKQLITQIKDTGIGIARTNLDRIFERFYRVDKSRSQEVGGTGLGLAIVKHIINLHQGSIGVESVLLLGTTVTVKLPLD